MATARQVLRVQAQQQQTASMAAAACITILTSGRCHSQMQCLGGMLVRSAGRAHSTLSSSSSCACCAATQMSMWCRHLETAAPAGLMKLQLSHLAMVP